MGLGTGVPCSDCGLSSPPSSTSTYYPPATVQFSCVSVALPSFNANTGRHAVWKQYLVANLSNIRAPGGASIGWTSTELLLPGAWSGGGITAYKSAGGKFVMIQTYPGTLLGTYSGVSTYTFYLKEILAVTGSYIYHRRWETSPAKAFKSPDDNTESWYTLFGSQVPGNCVSGPGFTYKESPILCPMGDVPATVTVTATLGEKSVFHDDGGVCCSTPSGGDGNAGLIYDGTRTINVVSVVNVDGWCVSLSASGPSCIISGSGSPGTLTIPYQNFDVDFNAWKPQSLGGVGINTKKAVLSVTGGVPCPWTYPACNPGYTLPVPSPFTTVIWGDALNSPSGVSVSGASISANASLTGGGYGPHGAGSVCKQAKRWDGVPDATNYYYAPGSQKLGGGSGSEEYATLVSSNHTQSDINVSVP